MALTLTDEQRRQVDPKRLPDAKLPKIFDRTSQQDVPISRDFEAMLILLPRQTKQAAVNWAQAVSDFEPDVTDQRAVLAQYLDVEFDGLAERTEQAASDIDQYETFKQGLQQVQVEGGLTVPEMQTLVNDMNALFGERTEKLERSLNGQMVNRLLYRRLVEGQDFDQRRKELRSFVTALLTY